MKFICLSFFIFTLTSCATYLPSNPDNICAVFRGEPDWYEAALDAQKEWGTPVYVMMAFMHQESRFVHDAQPEFEWFLFIPLGRASSAYGFAQVKDETWEEYQDATGNSGADRDDLEDAIDFIGWYTDVTHKRLGLSKWDAYGQYLAYHEGRGGYQRQTYKGKPWLIKVAQKVKARASLYNSQLKGCKDELDDAISWF